MNVLSVYQDNHHCFVFPSLSIKFLIEGEQTDQLGETPGLMSNSDCPGKNESEGRMDPSNLNVRN